PPIGDMTCCDVDHWYELPSRPRSWPAPPPGRGTASTAGRTAAAADRGFSVTHRSDTAPRRGAVSTSHPTTQRETTHACLRLPIARTVLDPGLLVPVVRLDRVAVPRDRRHLPQSRHGGRRQGAVVDLCHPRAVARRARVPDR